MIIVTITQPGVIQRGTFPDDQWPGAKEYEKGYRGLVQPHAIKVEFKLGYPDGYSLYEGAGCVLPGHKPENVFPVWSTSPFERTITLE